MIQLISIVLVAVVTLHLVISNQITKIIEQQNMSEEDKTLISKKLSLSFRCLILGATIIILIVFIKRVLS